MKKMFQVTALAAVLLLMSASAWSATYQDHVHQSGSGKGDVLIYPLYMAFDGGFQTKIQVINTSLDMSAVAKVVFRSPLWSIETLDFMIFLSPTDMWEGIVIWDGNQVVLYTEDDSFLISEDPAFASIDEPFIIDLADPGCGDTNGFGYAEVFLSWVFPNLSNIPTPKEDIYEEYVGTGNILNPIPASGFSPSDFGLDFGVRPNILAGNQQIQNAVLGWSSALNAVTLKDYGNQRALSPVVETVFGDFADNSMDEMEAALSKDWVGMPYINNDEGNTLHLFTFPTKLTQVDADCRIIGTAGNYIGFEGTFQDKVAFNVRAMDMTEQTERANGRIFSPLVPDRELNFQYEVNVFMPDAFAAGWYQYTFTEGSTQGVTQDTLFGLPDGDYLRYDGAPVIPVVMNFGAGGFSTMYGVSTDTPVYGKDDGLPTGLDVLLEGYQWARNTPGT